MPNSDVAVLIPVYNQANLVLNALDCIARQSLLPRRIVVIDDGSKDGTADAVAKWMQTTRPAIETTLIRQPRNCGAPAAINRGLTMVRDCRFFAVLDSDDLWPVDFVERGYGALSPGPEAVAATCDQLHVFEGSHETQLFDAREIGTNAACWFFSNGAGIFSATMLATKNILKLGDLNERQRTGYDIELLLSLSLLGPWIHLPGSPTTFLRPPRQRSAMTHLSEKYFDNQRRWALIHEEFIERRGGKRVVPRRLYTRALADRWKHAGHQLMQAGRTTEARRCLLRSLSWRPWRSNVWAQLLATYSSTAAPSSKLRMAAE